MSNIIDKIRISGVTYTLNGTVSSAITSGDTNPVEGGVLYDELRLPTEGESGLTLEWYNHDGGYTTNYPSGSGCSKITFEVVASGETEGDEWYQDEGWFYVNNDEGNIHIAISDDIVTASAENGFLGTCSVNGNIVTVEYPTIADDVTIWYSSYDNHWTTTAYINSTVYTPLINQVSANTIAISEKQDILSAGTNITISGNVISATGGGSGNPTVELTQAEYDALVESGTVQSDTYYIITDAQAGDLTQYWTSAQTQSAINQATSGKVNTSSVVNSVTSASTDSEIPTAKAVWEAASGGGTTYTAGRGISIANDTISFNLPISAGTGTNSVAEGVSTKANGFYSHAEGEDTEAYGRASHAEGGGTRANGFYSHAEGAGTTANNRSEHASGQFNISSQASMGFGDSGNTLFSVGNGTANNARHNAFEVRQNGDIYFNDGTSDVKLQDKFSTIETTIGDINTLLSQI